MRGTTAEDQMASNGRDVKAILSEVRYRVYPLEIFRVSNSEDVLQQKRTILHGCFIVFSGVFPIVGPQSHESHYLWRLSMDLGATPSMTLKDFPLTHLVIHPERLGTQKHVQVCWLFVFKPVSSIGVALTMSECARCRRKKILGCSL